MSICYTYIIFDKYATILIQNLPFFNTLDFVPKILKFDNTISIYIMFLFYSSLEMRYTFVLNIKIVQ